MHVANHVGTVNETYLLTKDAGMIEKVANHMIRGTTLWFPKLKKNRYFHSFNDAVYDVKADRFLKFEDLPAKIVPIKHHACMIKPGVLDEFRGDFETGGWMDIPTPDIDKIFIDQQITGLNLRWVYASTADCYLTLAVLISFRDCCSSSANQMLSSRHW